MCVKDNYKKNKKYQRKIVIKKIKEMNDWVQDKVEKGRAWNARPKIWMARGRASEPAFSNRYYIAAVTRDDAIDVLNQFLTSLSKIDGAKGLKFSLNFTF